VIDTHVYLGRWPARRLPDGTTAALLARLRRHGVRQAWAGAFDGIFQEDLGAVNARLAEECRATGMLVPFGSVNPRLPGWREHLRQCHERHKMPGIRLHPGYHGYATNDPEFAELARQAAAYGMVVQIVLAMEDDRTLRPPFTARRVDPAPLAELLRAVPDLRVVLLNAARPVPPASRMWVDFAMREGVEGLRTLAAQTGARQVVFGSMLPLFYFESALLKVKEADLPAADRGLILEENAAGLLRA